MGSSLTADLFMDKLEREVFASENPLTQYVQYWYRYVDDTLYLWNGTFEQLHDFHVFLNSLYPSIKLTLAIGRKQINFRITNILLTSIGNLLASLIFSSVVIPFTLILMKSPL